MNPINPKESHADVESRVHLFLNGHEDGDLLFEQKSAAQKEQTVSNDFHMGLDIHH